MSHKKSRSQNMPTATPKNASPPSPADTSSAPLSPPPAPRRIWTMLLAAGIVIGGFAIGLEVGFHHPAAAMPNITTRSATGIDHKTGTPHPHFTTPFTAGQYAPLTAAVRTLNGTPAHLARGKRGTIVIAMASWCLFCGYEDKWALPPLMAQPGVVLDVVDVSPLSGIADPGPQSPPFSGHDGSGTAINTKQMEQVMRQYVARFGTLQHAHVYVATAATRKKWHVTSFPSIAFINAKGLITVNPPGALTQSQAAHDLKIALQSSATTAKEGEGHA